MVDFACEGMGKPCRRPTSVAGSHIPTGPRPNESGRHDNCTFGDDVTNASRNLVLGGFVWQGWTGLFHLRLT